jgi:hypothetical protein
MTAELRFFSLNKGYTIPHSLTMRSVDLIHFTDNIVMFFLECIFFLLIYCLKVLDWPLL